MTQSTNYRITRANFYKLSEWVKETNNTDQRFPSGKAEAQAASKSLGFEVTMHHMYEAFKVTGFSLVEVDSKPKRADRIQIIAYHLIELMKELGKEPPEGLIAVFKRKGQPEGETNEQ